MVDPNLLTAYVVVTGLAVLVQTGIVAGLYLTTARMTRKADLAVAEAQRLVEPAHEMVHALEAASMNFAMFTAKSVGNLRQFESQVGRTVEQFRRKIG